MYIFLFKIWAAYKRWKYVRARKRWLKKIDGIILDPGYDTIEFMNMLEKQRKR